MNDFKTYALGQETLDPTKRVHYSTGLVLGVDEFLQHDVHFIERDRLHNRSLHGYGTVCGLAVSQRESGAGPEIVVTAGVAVNPQGQEIRVPVAQCARLDTWLAGHSDEIEARLGSPPEGSLALQVVLCYRECETDLTPIPGEPCRTQDDSMAPSRIAEDFELSLALVSPEAEQPRQAEEEAARRFGDLLCRIQLTAAPDALDAEELAQLARHILLEAPPAESPPETSPPADIPLSPPLEAGGPIPLHPDEAPAILRHVFKVWVTEIRPALLPAAQNCASGPPDELCVLLARLEVEVAEVSQGRWQAVGEVTIDETRRPYLLPGRLLQEWLLCGRSTPGAGGSATNHGALTGLAADDHPLYLRADGTRALTGDLSAGNNRLTDLAEATADGQAVRFEQALKTGDSAGGDLRSKYPDPTVRGLQGRNVANVDPEAGQVLTWNPDVGPGRWEPQDPQGADGEPALAPENFVQAPGAPKPYAIVAAGFFEAGGNARGPVYGELKAIPHPDRRGDYLLTFARYRPPDETVTYIVKGTVEDPSEPAQTRATFQIVGFVSHEEVGEAIQVRVFDTNNEPAELGFMVEISAFGEVEI